MSWKSRATSGPPKKSLAYLDQAVFVIDGFDVSGKEFVKVYENLRQGIAPQDTRLHRDAILWLRSNGHVIFDNKERRYVAVTKESA